MLKIRLRYPLLLLILVAIYGFWIDASDLPKTAYSQLSSPPELTAGYYVVLHTPAKLPQDIPIKTSKTASFIGPLHNMKTCHEMRSKIHPHYPGVMQTFIKISQSEINS